MNENQLSAEEIDALIEATISDAKEMLAVAQVNYDYEFYNSAMNRLYYACFHIARAALFSIGITHAKSHEGVRNMFSLHFIKTGKLSASWNHFYPFIFSCRSSADYDSFVRYTKVDIDTIMPQAVQFVEEVCDLIYRSRHN